VQCGHMNNQEHNVDKNVTLPQHTAGGPYLHSTKHLTCYLISTLSVHGLAAVVCHAMSQHK